MQQKTYWWKICSFTHYTLRGKKTTKSLCERRGLATATDFFCCASCLRLSSGASRSSAEEGAAAKQLGSVLEVAMRHSRHCFFSPKFLIIWGLNVVQMCIRDQTADSEVYSIKCEFEADFQPLWSKERKWSKLKISIRRNAIKELYSPLKSVAMAKSLKDLNQETGELKRVQFYPWANFDKWRWALGQKKKEKEGGIIYLWNSISQ